MGRLIFANLPPFDLFQVQTFGGTYSDELAIPLHLPFGRIIDDCGFSASARAIGRDRGRHTDYGSSSIVKLALNNSGRVGLWRRSGRACLKSSGSQLKIPATIARLPPAPSLPHPAQTVTPCPPSIFLRSSLGRGDLSAGPETVIAQGCEEAHQQPDQEQNNDDQEDHPYGIAPGNSDAGINGRSSTAAKEE